MFDCCQRIVSYLSQKFPVLVENVSALVQVNLLKVELLLTFIFTAFQNFLLYGLRKL